MRGLALALTLVLALIAPLPALAQTVSPAPAEREMETDRPDKTESPYTVPAGRIQIELDLANHTHDRDDTGRVDTLGVAPFNLKLGVDDSTDVQLVVAPYLLQATRTPGDGRTVTSGVGDVTIRLKRNLWGNDDGGTAFGLMSYITLPTSHADLGTNLVEFGLIAPLVVKLSEKVDLGLMTEIDAVARQDGGGRRINLVNSATLGLSLTDKLGLYSELFAERAEQWEVTGDVGFTYAVEDETQLDAGVNLGLTDAADDVTIFVGLSRRF